MKKILALVFILTTTHAFAFTQYYQPDVTTAFGNRAQSAAISFTHFVQFGEKYAFRIGYGPRYSMFFASDRSYETADADLIGLGIKDHLTVGQANTHAFNLAGHMAFGFLENWEVGLNIDLIGFSLGPSTDGTFQAMGSTTTSAVRADPNGFNAFLLGRHDRGSLNSQFYVAYRLSDAWGVRAGFCHFINEYDTATIPANGNDRFRLPANLFFASAFYRFGNR